jgi:hypothetical protein
MAPRSDGSGSFTSGAPSALALGCRVRQRAHNTRSRFTSTMPEGAGPMDIPLDLSALRDREHDLLLPTGAYWLVQCDLVDGRVIYDVRVHHEPLVTFTPACYPPHKVPPPSPAGYLIDPVDCLVPDFKIAEAWFLAYVRVDIQQLVQEVFELRALVRQAPGWDEFVAHGWQEAWMAWRRRAHRKVGAE